MINKGNIANAIKELKSNKNNAVAHIFDKKTLNEGKGKLQNCIFTVKDNYADVNVNCKASSLLLNNFRPQYKATVIDLLSKNSLKFSVVLTLPFKDSFIAFSAFGGKLL